MRGKYSPTVTDAYCRDQAWHDKLLASHGTFDADGKPCEYSRYDVDGYDSYGYNKQDVDRAGNHENDYASDDYDADDQVIEGYNWLYEQALSEWKYDGVRPIQKA